MGVLERRAREKEALRARILDAATSLFVEEGYENVSIRRIADLIEYSPATIYLYFKDKAELIAAICEEAFAEMMERIGSARESSADPIEGLRRGLRAYIDFGIAHPGHYKIVFGTAMAAVQPNPACGKPDDLGLQTFSLLRDGLQACMQAGVLPPTHVETAAQVTWMSIHGVTSLAIHAAECAGFPWLDRSHLIESALDLVIAGLRNATFHPPTR